MTVPVRLPLPRGSKDAGKERGGGGQGVVVRGSGVLGEEDPDKGEVVVLAEVSQLITGCDTVFTGPCPSTGDVSGGG